MTDVALAWKRSREVAGTIPPFFFKTLRVSVAGMKLSSKCQEGFRIAAVNHSHSGT